MLLEGNVLPQLEKNSAIKRLNLMNRFLPSGTRFLESFRIRTVGKPWNREQKRPPVREQTRALRYRSYNYEMFSTNRATEKNERSTGENVGYSRFPSSKWQKIIFLQRLLALRRWSPNVMKIASLLTTSCLCLSQTTSSIVRRRDEYGQKSVETKTIFFPFFWPLGKFLELELGLLLRAKVK